MDLLPMGSAGADAVCKRALETVRRSRRTLGVTGLTPGAGDALKVELALEQIPGVVHAYVNPVTEMAYIEYDPEQASEDLLAAAIESAGFRTVPRAGDL
jgi:cation transport ATPase